MSATRPFVVIGNPENRRVAYFQEALVRRGQSPALVLSYIDLLTGRASANDVRPHAIVRIDSPGENFAVEKRLLIAGERAAADEGGPVISAREVERLPDDPGRILYPRQWFLGFRELLGRLGEQLLDRGDVMLASQPHDIPVMFDKPECHRQCQRAGIPVPRSLASVSSFDELAEQMTEQHLERIFIKLAHGSSASGVVALYRQGDRFEAITTAELVRQNGTTCLYNSLKIQRYTGIDDVRDLIEGLLPHRVHLEEWLPKASLAGRVCDLRVVVIAGEPQHMVVRTSRSPLTNLHLGNRRGDLDSFLDRLSEAQRRALDDTCRRVAVLYPHTLQMAADVLFTPGFKRHFLLEINAFGDLLPRVLCAGKTTYEAQIDALAEYGDTRSAVVTSTAR